MDELVDETKFKQLSPEQVEAWIMVSPTHLHAALCNNLHREHSCFQWCGLWGLLGTRKAEQRLIPLLGNYHWYFMCTYYIIGY